MLRKPLALMKKAFNFIKPKPKDAAPAPKKTKSQKELLDEEAKEKARKLFWWKQRVRWKYTSSKVRRWRAKNKVGYRSRRAQRIRAA